MAKPSIYRVSQKRQGVIIDTTGPAETLDRHVSPTLQNSQPQQLKPILRYDLFKSLRAGA